MNKKMIKCKACGNDIASSAETCPSCGAKNKKPFYTRWWFILIAIIIVLGAIGSNANKTTTNTNNTANNTNSNADKNTVANESENKDKIKAGTYKVGTDIPAGEYIVFSSNNGYIECSKDSTGSFENIIFNDNLLNGANSYVTLNDGEYFKIQRAEMYPVSSSPSVKPEDGIYKNGTYKVGTDIPAGEYKVKDNGNGYIEVTTNSRHDLLNIVSNENLNGDSYITVSEGQYIKINNATIQK